MEVVDVAPLPWPHHPSKCHFWAQLAAAVPAELRDADSEAVQPILERATRSLPTDEVRRCRYHRPDWRRAAAAAIDFWAATGSEDCFEAGDWFAAHVALGEEELWAAASFFREPIWLNGPCSATVSTASVR
ncbi:MAG: hypothetical protein JWO14_2209 [Solirubrobacterales bacterium]|nr:hypothetical protein [Solirubrobacterales bacterium]